MSNAGEQIPQTKITSAIGRVLQEGALAVLATIVEAPHDSAKVGAKILFDHPDPHDHVDNLREPRDPRDLPELHGASEPRGTYAGTTGDRALDEALAAQAAQFLATRAEARTLRVEEFAPHLEEWREARVLFERIEPEPHVVVCGAGHVGASLARLARAVGYRVTLIDDRADFVAPERFAGEGIELVTARNWTEPVRAAIGTGRGVSVAVVTRGHNEDEECLRAVLATRPDYVGMIGSKRRTNIVLARLRADGVAEEILREVRAPVGLDIGAVSPAEVALAILAEIVAARRGGTGAPLSAWRRV